MQQLTLTPDTVGPIARGHPWVYHDGVVGKARMGDLVELLDGRGRRVAFGLWDEGTIAVRVLGPEPMPLRDLLQARIRSAQDWRDRCVSADTDACRLVNGEGDGLPGLVVDRYGDLAVVRLYTGSWERHLSLVVDALRQLPWVARVARRFGVERVDGRDGLESLAGPPVPASFVVREAGLRFLVRPAEGQKTGLFLDQRENRRWVRGVSSGVTVVNLFGYTGGFSVYAAAGGARSTVTVDVSAAALEDARENLKLNGLDPACHALVRADAFHWAPEGPADVVVCDPPSLARSERAEAAARKAYRDLNVHAAGMVRDEGLLVTASCTARLGEQRWMEAVRHGLQQVGGAWLQVHRAGEPPDHPVGIGHPEGHYLKMAAFRRLATLPTSRAQVTGNRGTLPRSSGHEAPGRAPRDRSAR